LDKKLKYQIDKLLKLATVGDTQSSTEGETKDPLQFKPNPENLVAKDDEIGNENGVYVPNQLAAAYFDDKEDKKKGDARALRRAAKSSIIQSLREEFSDQPEELDVTGGGRKEKLDAREAELEKFEEENMVRLSISKKDKKRKRNINELETIDDYNDLRVISDDVVGLEEKEKEKKNNSLKQYINKIEQASKRNKLSSGGDDDLPYKEHPSKKQNINKTEALSYADDGNEDSDVGNDIQDNMEEDEFYTQIKQAREIKETNKEEKFSSRKPKKNFEEEPGDGKRAATHQIIKNRGLTANKKKETKNAKSRLRAKYEKALIRQKGVAPAMRTQENTYSGESTGIRKNIVRSAKLDRI